MSVKKNLVYNILYQVLILIIPLITTPYISRVIGPEGIGIHSYTYSIVNYFVLFAMLGINNHGNRSIAMVKDNKEELSKTFVSIYSLQIIMSILMIIIYSIVFIFIGNKYRAFFAIQFIYIIATLLDINWFFFGMEEFKLTVIRNSVVKVLSMLSIFIFVNDSSDLHIYMIILALGTLLSQIILWKFIGRYIKFIKVSKEDIIKQLKPTIVLFIPVIAVSIYKIMDKIMLGSISGINQVGFYENSEKIINIPISIIVALGTVMLPKIANLESKGQGSEIKRYISISIEFIMFIAFGATFGLIGISPILIPVFLGEKFADCINLVSLLSITILFISWANVIRTQFLIPKKKDRIYINSTILGAIVNLFVNLLLIKTYGALGAVFGTVLAEASVAIYQTIKIRKELDIYNYLKRTVFYIIPASVMFILVRSIGVMLSISVLTVLIQVIIGGIVYISISLCYMYTIKNEIVYKYIRKIISKKYSFQSNQ